jgi:hypothetical protein
MWADSTAATQYLKQWNGKSSTTLHCTELLHTTKPEHALHFIFAICEVLFSSGHYTGLRQTLDVLLKPLADRF